MPQVEGEEAEVEEVEEVKAELEVGHRRAVKPRL